MFYFDLSQTIEDDLPAFPEDLKTRLSQIRYLDKNEYNDYELDTGMHSGTHIDGPMHLLFNSREFISDISIESFIGPGCVLDVRNQPVIKMKPEYEQLVKESSIVLLYTGQNKLFGKPGYFENHPVVELDFCELLIKKQVKMLGIDTPSPDRHPYPVHKFLLSRGIYIIENLTNLEKLIGLANIEVLALPLKIKADSSIARVVARQAI